MTVEYREQFVWPLAVRLIHWLLAIAITVLLLTGWLLGSGLLLNEQLYQLLRVNLHIPAGKVAGVALGARMLLLAFDPGVAGWRALLRYAKDLPATGEMLKFYLSFGRRDVPHYFAHDPLWSLVYPVWLLVIGLQVLSGMALVFDPLRSFAGLSVDTWARWHELLAATIFWFVLVHVLSVLLREVRGKGYDISAMVQGHRIFKVDRGDGPGGRPAITVAVNDILKPGARRD